MRREVAYFLNVALMIEQFDLSRAQEPDNHPLAIAARKAARALTGPNSRVIRTILRDEILEGSLGLTGLEAGIDESRSRMHSAFQPRFNENILDVPVSGPSGTIKEPPMLSLPMVEAIAGDPVNLDHAMEVELDPDAIDPARVQEPVDEVDLLLAEIQRDGIQQDSPGPSVIIRKRGERALEDDRYAALEAALDAQSGRPKVSKGHGPTRAQIRMTMSRPLSPSKPKRRAVPLEEKSGITRLEVVL